MTSQPRGLPETIHRRGLRFVGGGLPIVASLWRRVGSIPKVHPSTHPSSPTHRPERT